MDAKTVQIIARYLLFVGLKNVYVDCLVGSVHTTSEQHPYFVLIAYHAQIPDYKGWFDQPLSFCPGVIVDASTIATAVSCIRGNEDSDSIFREPTVTFHC